MYQYVLFGGTTEGRVLAKAFVRYGIKAAVFVATEYGEQALEDDLPEGRSEDCPDVFARRLDEEEMFRFFERHQPLAVIDATHPYAAIVSGNIRRAAASAGIRYIRVLRPSTLEPETEQGQPVKIRDGESQTPGTFVSDHSRFLFFQNMDQMLSWLNTTDEIIFSTLGAKDLPSLARIRDYEKRVFVRILPTVEGISSCSALGFPMRHILGLHGPFSEEYNLAQYRATGAGIVITKDTGTAGGFDEKVRAALKLGLTVAVLQRPVDERDVVTLEALLEQMERSFTANENQIRKF